jgi:hypothetical protein
MGAFLPTNLLIRKLTPYQVTRKAEHSRMKLPNLKRPSEMSRETARAGISDTRNFFTPWYLSNVYIA